MATDDFYFFGQIGFNLVTMGKFAMSVWVFVEQGCLLIEFRSGGLELRDLRLQPPPWLVRPVLR